MKKILKIFAIASIVLGFLLNFAPSLGVNLVGGGPGTIDRLPSAGGLTDVSGQYKVYYTVCSAHCDYITDGTADDVQIQAAIDAANSAGGGEIYIKSGNYNIRNSLILPDDTLLNGNRLSILKRDVSMSAGIIIKNSDTTSGNSNIQINGITVDGSSQLVTAVDGMESIRLDLCTNCLVTNVNVINSPSEGIQLHRGINSVVSNSIVVGTATISGSYKAGIIVSGNTDPSEQSVDCKIINNYTENTSGEGVGSYYSRGTKIQGNTIRWTSGVDNKSEILVEHSTDVQVLGNTVTSNLDGIISLSSQRIIISSNTIKSATNNGISIEGSSRDIVISNNSINTVQENAINLQDISRNISILVNEIVDAGQGADNTYYAINLNPNGGFLRRITITGTHSYSSASNKIKSFIGTTTDVNNQIDGLYEKGNFSEGEIGPFRTVDNDIYVDFTDAEFINNNTDNGLYIEQDGILGANKRGLYLNVTSDLTSSARQGALFYTNVANTAGYLFEMRDDNSSSTLTAVQRIQADGVTGFGALYIDNNNNGRSINIDHDGNSASAITGEYIDVANAGAGAAYGLIVNAGRTGLMQSTPTAYLHLGAGTATVSTAPLKFTSGTNLGTTEAGAVEYDGSHLYFTASNGGTRYQLDQQVSAAGAITRSISSISSPTTAGSVVNTDYVYFVSGTTTLTLPTAVGNTNMYTVKNTGSNTVTIATTSAQTIDGSSTITLPVANTSVDLLSDNANWRVK